MAERMAGTTVDKKAARWAEQMAALSAYVMAELMAALWGRCSVESKVVSWEALWVDGTVAMSAGKMVAYWDATTVAY